MMMIIIIIIIMPRVVPHTTSSYAIAFDDGWLVNVKDDRFCCVLLSSANDCTKCSRLIKMSDTKKTQRKKTRSLIFEMKNAGRVHANANNVYTNYDISFWEVYYPLPSVRFRCRISAADGRAVAAASNVVRRSLADKFWSVLVITSEPTISR